MSSKQSYNQSIGVWLAVAIILVVVIIFCFKVYMRKHLDVRAKSHMAQILMIAKMFKSDYGYYPHTMSDLLSPPKINGKKQEPFLEFHEDDTLKDEYRLLFVKKTIVIQWMGKDCFWDTEDDWIMMMNCWGDNEIKGPERFNKHTDFTHPTRTRSSTPMFFQRSGAEYSSVRLKAEGSTSQYTRRYHVQDLNWNVVASTNWSGSEVELVTYDPYGLPTFYNGSGESTSALTSNVDVDFLFQGRWLELFQFGSNYVRLYHFRHRAYGPKLGRFLQRDPIGIWGDGVNLGNGYGFVGGRPLLLNDPYGNYPPGLSNMPPPPSVGIEIRRELKEIRQRQRSINCFWCSEGYSYCDRYHSAPDCCDEDTGKWREDKYPEEAINYCHGFMDLYCEEDLVKKVALVALCLVNAEEECQKIRSCSERNQCRFNAHIKCYTQEGFIEEIFREIFGGNGMPEGAIEWGIGELFEDWFGEQILEPQRDVFCDPDCFIITG